MKRLNNNVKNLNKKKQQQQQQTQCDNRNNKVTCPLFPTRGHSFMILYYYVKRKEQLCFSKQNCRH